MPNCFPTTTGRRVASSFTDKSPYGSVFIGGPSLCEDGRTNGRPARRSPAAITWLGSSKENFGRWNSNRCSLCDSPRKTGRLVSADCRSYKEGNPGWCSMPSERAGQLRKKSGGKKNRKGAFDSSSASLPLRILSVGTGELAFLAGVHLLKLEPTSSFLSLCIQQNRSFSEDRP